MGAPRGSTAKRRPTEPAGIAATRSVQALDLAALRDPIFLDRRDWCRLRHWLGVRAIVSELLVRITDTRAAMSPP